MDAHVKEFKMIPKKLQIPKISFDFDRRAY